MNPLPMPLRIAAGLVATAVEQAKELPRKVVELPVTAVSQAMQASMRLQQKVTDLAIKGDRAISFLRPAAENPTWARFDEDEPLADRDGPDRDRPDRGDPDLDVPATDAAGNGSVSPLHPAGAAPAAPAGLAGATAEVCPLPGYDELTIAQLRARLRRLSVETLQDLLSWETAHQNRPPFVTMLSNRITTVSAD